VISFLKHHKRIPLELAAILDDIDIIFTLLNSEDSDEEVKYHVWNIYAVDIKGMDRNPAKWYENDFDEIIMEIGAEALIFFQTKLHNAIQIADDEDFINSIYYLTSMTYGSLMIDSLLNIAVKRFDGDVLRLEIIPRIMISCAIQRNVKEVGAIMEHIIDNAKEYITIDTANSMMEYSAHVHGSLACVLVLSHMQSLVTVEGDLNSY
jgi:hypothetical protein